MAAWHPPWILNRFKILKYIIASERSEQAPSTCIYWNQNKSIKSLIFVLDIWCIEKKSLILMSAPQLNNEPARPGPARP